MGGGQPACCPPVPLICRPSGEAQIDRDIAIFGVGRRTGHLQLRRRPTGRAAMTGGPEGGPIACRIDNGIKARGRSRILQVPAAVHTDTGGMAHLAPDPHPEDAPARGSSRGICASLLLRCVPSVPVDTQCLRVFVTTPRVPFIGGERPAHEGHAARALFGRIGLAGDGDSTVTGIGAGRVVEFDPAAESRTVGAMVIRSHAEGRLVVSHSVRVIQGLDRQVVDHAGQGLIVNYGRRPD